MPPPDSSDIDAALMALLQNDAALQALMPDGVFDEEGAVQNATRYVSVLLYEHEDVNTFQQGGYENAVYQIEALSRSGILTNMKAAAHRIHVLLQDGTLEVPGFTCMTMFRERRTRTVERDPVDKAIRWFRRGGYYRVQMSVDEPPPPPPVDLYRTCVLADGAIAYWRLDETSGTVAADALGTYTGTISGDVTLGVPGALSVDDNTAMTFVQGQIDAAALPAAALGFSIEAWLYLSTPPPPNETVIVSRNRAVQGGYRLSLLHESGELGLRMLLTIPAFAWIDSIKNLTVGAWQYVVLTYTNGTVTFYVNGVLNKTAAFTIPPDAATPPATIIGIDPLSGLDTAFKGTLDEMAVYPHALTPAQIADHYALGLGPPSGRAR